MATNFSNQNVKQTVVERFFEGLYSVSEQWAQAYDYRRNDIADLRISPITGVSSIPQWNGGDLPVQELEALTPQLVQYEKYGVQVRVDKYDAKDVPESTTTLPQRIGVATAQTYAAKAVEVLDNAFGSATTSVDGLALCATNHVTKVGTRSNKLTTALDSAAIMAAIAMFRMWRDYQGMKRDVVQEGGFYLIIPPDLEEAAGQALGSSVTSDQMQVNMAGSYGIDPIVWNHLPTRTTGSSSARLAARLSSGSVRRLTFRCRLTRTARRASTRSTSLSARPCRLCLTVSSAPRSEAWRV